MNEQNHEYWDELFDQLPIDTSPDSQHQAKLKARALAAFDDQSTVQPLPPEHRIKKLGSILMKYKVPHWTVAGTMLAGIFWLVSSGGKSAVAVDQVVDNMVNAKTAKFEMIVKVTGQPQQKFDAFYMAPSHFRQEIAGGMVNIADWEQGRMIGLNESTKQATLVKLVNLTEEHKTGSQMNQFDMIRERLRQATENPETEVESLGEKRIDGRDLVGFRFPESVQPMTIWADPITHFPVRIESTMVGPPQTEVVMSNYEFNVDLDESLFSMEIPDDYKVIEMEVDATPPTEADFIASLKMGCEMSGGQFPDGFDAVAIGAYVGKAIASQSLAAADGPSPELLEKVAKLSRGFQFAMTLPKTANAHYAGQNVKLGDSDRPIFWYKPEGPETYRVLYADLSVKETAKAPEVEGARKLSP